MHGVYETNPIGLGYHESFNPTRKVDWTEPGLYVTRLRLLSDPGFPAWDVSYCHGRIGDEDVEVSLPFHQIPKRGFAAYIIKCAKEDGVHAKRLGLFDNISKLIQGLRGDPFVGLTNGFEYGRMDPQQLMKGQVMTTTTLEAVIFMIGFSSIFGTLNAVIFTVAAKAQEGK